MTNTKIAAQPVESLPPMEQVEHLAAQAEVRTTPCGKGRMVWRLWGEGTPLVLLHGGSGSWTHWLRNIPVLAQQYRVIAADLPGLGDSDTPPLSDTVISTMQGVARIVSDGLDALLSRSDPLHLAGFSYGSITGGHVAARQGERVRSFTMIGAAALGLGWGGLKPLRSLRPGMTAVERAAIHRHNLGVIMLARPENIDPLAEHLQLRNLDRARLKTHEIARTDALRRALPRIQAPLKAIWGALDPFALPDMAGRENLLRQFDPALYFRVIEGAGHWVMYEAADRFNAALLDALQSEAGPLPQRREMR